MTLAARKPEAKPIGIMVVDDHQTMLWGLERLIESEAPRMQVVGTATTCAEALEKVRELTPDVVLLDLDMGDESGLDILPALLSNAVSQVLILTGARDQSTLDAAVMHGARGILRKDAPAAQVLKAIEKVHGGELWLDHETIGRMLGKLTIPIRTAHVDRVMKKNDMLTTKEQTIIQTIVEENGASNKLMAQKLFISEHTLRNHLSSIYQKLGVRNRLELYVYAVKHKLARPQPVFHARDLLHGRGVGSAQAH